MSDESGFNSKSIPVYLGIMLAGGAVGAGGITVAGNATPSAEVRVTIPETIKVELPPDQVALMNKVANAEVISQITSDSVARFEAKFDASLQVHREELKEQRLLDDALRTALSNLTQEVGIARRQSESNAGRYEDIEKRVRILERTSSNPLPSIRDD